MELGAERTPDMHKELLSGPEKPLPSSLPPCVCLEAVNPGLAALEICKHAYSWGTFPLLIQREGFLESV